MISDALRGRPPRSRSKGDASEPPPLEPGMTTVGSVAQPWPCYEHGGSERIRDVQCLERVSEVR